MGASCASTSSVRVPQVELCSGYYVSRLIKGGWQTIGRGEDALADLLAFVEAGVTTFETSDSYEGGEALMGALRKAAREHLDPALANVIKVHTRFTAPLDGPGPDERAVVRAIEASLERLGVDTLDLVQLQWWNLDVPGLIDAGLVLTDLQHQGKVGLIGAANFGVATLERLLNAGVPIATNQVLYSLIDRRPENRLASFCAESGISLMTFAPLGGGFLSERWRSKTDPRESGEEHSAEYRALIEAGGGWSAYRTLLETLAGIAERHARSIATVALAWTLTRGPGKAILFGASSPERLPETMAAFGVALTAGDIAEIEACAFVRSQQDVGEIERAPDSALMRAIRAHHD